jgi:predicted adenylyl cyclase CyaB
LVNNISKGNSKVAFKDGLLNKTNVFPEYEVEIKQEDFEKMKLIFSKILSPKKIFEGVQKRYNFEIDGCEIAVKWSESWGYHFEIEKMISEDENPEDVYEEFDKITKKLGIRTSTDEEIKKFLEKYQ